MQSINTLPFTTKQSMFHYTNVKDILHDNSKHKQSHGLLNLK